MKTVVTARQLLTPSEVIGHAVVVIDEDRILELGPRSEISEPSNARRHDFPEAVLVPGLIDIHVHGGSGHDVMETSPSALATIERGMCRRGVTSYLPTTVTAPIPATLQSLEHLGKAIRSQLQEPGRSRPLGVHLEGPFISHAKRGVHPPDNLQPPSPELLLQLHEAAAGTVKMLTIAPELDGSVTTIAAAMQLGIVSSLGHSDATFAQAQAGIEAGARHATHTFNAMRLLDHREPGILGAVLSNDRVTADIIADGLHVAPSVIKIFLRAKGMDRAVLITDAISATGMGDGKYRLGGFEVEVKGNRCDLDGKLAGSVLTLDTAVRNVMSFASLNLQDAVRLATFNPARVLGLTETYGTLAPGRVADMAVVSPSGKVMATMSRGTLVAAE